jgi:oligopeptide/dipeptide ABC transporter ATP-binding protein
MSMLSAIAPFRPPPLLRMRGLTVKYPCDRYSAPALQGIDLDIAPGEIVGILGESGSGKSTLALSILGLLPPNASVEGSIVFQNNEDLLQIDEPRWKTIRGAKIALIGQEPGLCLSPVMSVGDQIAEVLRAHRPGGRKLREVECEAILTDLRFSDVGRISKAYPHQLSGGELHRVAIAQALVCQPDLVIADEATRSLDVAVQSEILNVLGQMKRRLRSALIFITHDPTLLAGFADRVITMYAGHIVEDGPVSSVFRQPLHPYTEGLLQLVRAHRQPESPDPQRLLPVIRGNSTDVDRSTAGCVFEPRCCARTAICREESPKEVMPEPGHRVSCFNHGN